MDTQTIYLSICLSIYLPECGIKPDGYPDTISNPSHLSNLKIKLLIMINKDQPSDVSTFFKCRAECHIFGPKIVLLSQLEIVKDVTKEILRRNLIETR